MFICLCFQVKQFNIATKPAKNFIGLRIRSIATNWRVTVETAEKSHFFIITNFEFTLAETHIKQMETISKGSQALQN